jgi:hypothetical protein
MEHAYAAAFDHGVCIGCGGAQPAELAPTTPAPLALLRVPEALDVRAEEGSVFVCFGPPRARLRIAMGVPEAHNLSDCIARAESSARVTLATGDRPFTDAEQASGLFPGLEDYGEPKGETIPSDQVIGWGAAPAEGGAVVLGFVLPTWVPYSPGNKNSGCDVHTVCRLLVHDARAFGGRVLRAAAMAQSQIQGTPYEGPTAEDDLSARGVVPRMGRA